MIRNQLYPYIEKYINDYLYGFTKEQMNLAITQGKLELNKINIRPDVINLKMNENNLPFWIKAGLINKISVGCSLINIIGEIPLEATIEGIEIIISPSYKWINEHLGKKSDVNKYNYKNPIGIDLNDKNKLEIKFDVSIFNKPYIEEIFKDKTAISNLINTLLKKLYDFYNMPNYAAILKISKIHIRLEDDELFNYEGTFVLGINIENITAKLGFQGSQKKNSLKIENFSIYWEKEPKLIIKNEILNQSMVLGKMGDEYYRQIKQINFSTFNNNTKNSNIILIIENYSLTINFGTKNKEKGVNDIFNIQNNLKHSYFQISSNELIINIYPEFLKAINYFSSFASNFSVIEKIKDYRPDKRPYDMNKDESNKDNNNNNLKKAIARYWFLYFIWKYKIQNKRDTLIENPIRAEFNRFYNIYHKKVDVFKLLKKMEEEQKKEEQSKDNINKEISNIENNNDNKDNKKNKDNNINTKKEKKDNKKTGQPEEIYTFEEFIKKYGQNKNSGDLKEEYDKYLDDKIKEKYSKFSSSIEISIKGFIINVHSSLNKKKDKTENDKKENIQNIPSENYPNKNNHLEINAQGIVINIGINRERFNFNFDLHSLDVGPSNKIYGERIIICPTSYRTNLVNQNNGLINNSNLIITNTDGNINEIHEQEKRAAGLSGLLKKYNPKYEKKLKIIDEALNKVGGEPKFISKKYNINTSNININSRNRPKSLLSSDQSKNGRANILTQTNVSTVNENLNQQDINIPGKLRNSSFAKSFIENCNEFDLRLKQKLKKQKNELNISQAINNYNLNNRSIGKNVTLNYIRNSKATNVMKGYDTIKLKENNKFIDKDKNKGNKPPLNFLEIYSNSNIGALKLKYTKYNNSFSLDDFSMQLGTIRLHPFSEYLYQMIAILLDYQKSQQKPKIKKSHIKSVDGGGTEGTKNLLKMRQLFCDILSKLPENEKTKTIEEYINYLQNEIGKLLVFNKDIDIKPFEINYLFNFFPKGIKFYFDYENIECVYYNNEKKILGKFMISPYTINVSISLSKIIANFLGINIEINNLIESKMFIEKLWDKCQKMLNDKKDMIKLIIEPCYESLKDELLNNGKFDNNILQNLRISLNNL